MYQLTERATPYLGKALIAESDIRQNGLFSSELHLTRLLRWSIAIQQLALVIRLMTDVSLENAMRIIRDASLSQSSSDCLELRYLPDDMAMLSSLARALDGIGYKAELGAQVGVLLAVRKHRPVDNCYVFYA